MTRKEGGMRVVPVSTTEEVQALEEACFAAGMLALPPKRFDRLTAAAFGAVCEVANVNPMPHPYAHPYGDPDTYLLRRAVAERAWVRIRQTVEPWLYSKSPSTGFP